MSKKLPLVDVINELFCKYKDYEYLDIFKAVKYGCTHPYLQSNEDCIRKLLMEYGIYTINSYSYLKVERNINNLGNIPENAIII